MKEELQHRQRQLRAQIWILPISVFCLLVILYCLYILSFLLGFPLGPNKLWLKIVIGIAAVVAYIIGISYYVKARKKRVDKKFRLEYVELLANRLKVEPFTLKFGDDLTPEKKLEVNAFNEMKDPLITYLIPFTYEKRLYDNFIGTNNKVPYLVINSELNADLGFYLQIRNDADALPHLENYQNQTIKVQPATLISNANNISFYSTLSRLQIERLISPIINVNHILKIVNDYKADSFIYVIAGKKVELTIFGATIDLVQGLNDELSNNFSDLAKRHYFTGKELLTYYGTSLTNLEINHRKDNSDGTK